MDILKKALLQTTDGSGINLVPQDLEPMLVEYLGRLSPLYANLPKKQAEGRTHEYTKRTAVPAAWFEGELTTPSPVASTYTRESVQLKILRIAGGVSGFQQAVSDRFINALEAEIIGSVEGYANLLEWSVLYGNAAADAYQFSGVDTFMASDAQAKTAVASGGNFLDVDGVIDLSALDSMIDAAHATRAADRDPKMFLMSQQMISKVSGLQTRVNRTVTQVEIEGGFRFATYRDIPLVPTSYVRPNAVTTSPTVTATAAAGGSLADDEYFYVIASVTDLGEQIAGVEDSATTATTNNSVALTWTADANAKLYKIYRGLATGSDNLGLLTTIAAKTYNADGSVNTNVAAFTDDGSYGTPNSAYRPLSSGEENIFLLNMSDMRGMQMVGMLSPLGEQTQTFVSYVPLATRKSAFEYMIEGFMAAMVPYPTLHVAARRAKLA